MLRRSLVALAAVLAVFAFVGLCSSESEDGLRRGKEALSARRFAEARTELAKVARESKGETADEAQLLVAKSYLYERRAADAVRLLEGFVRERAESAWCEKARFLLADAYALAGRADAASTALAERVRELSSPAERAALAGLYLALADESYEGQVVEEGGPLGQKKVVRDFARSLSLYERAQAIALPAPREAEVRFRVARCRYELGQHGAALEGLRAFLKAHGETGFASEAKFLAAECCFTQGRLDEARAYYRAVCEAHEDGAEAPRALERWGDTYAPLAPSSQEALRLGLALWEQYKAKYFGREGAAQVFWKAAQAQERAGRYEEAIGAYEDLLRRFPEGEQAGDARFQAAACAASLGAFERARKLYGAFLAAHPSHRLFVEAQGRIALSHVSEGEAALRDGRLDEAIAAWRRFLGEYPAHGQAASVQLRLGELFGKRGEWEQALAEWRVVASKYPGSREGARAQMAIARTEEKERGDLRAAIAAYRHLLEAFGGTPEAREAQEIIRVMQEPSLGVKTERRFGTGEKAALQVSTRNLERLEWKAYRVDLEATFRKKHGVASLEQVATEIVKADATWTEEVAGYEEFRLHERRHELPVPPGEGAWIVTCEGGELRAVTLVLVSDLQLLAKVCPGEVFLFAQSEAGGQGTPAAGVRVLVSDGQKVLHEGETGRDGVLRVALDGKKYGGGELRFFAAQGKHAAFTQGAPGSESSFGYSAKGYFFTDRPVYRPGQEVQWKGIVRGVERGAYRPTAQAEVEVWVKNPRGVAIAHEVLRTTRFGTVSGALVLGDEPPQGTYRIEARLGSDSFSASFEVESYVKPEFLVEVAPSPATVLSGEDVEAEVRARYTFGGAVKAASVEWEVWRREYAFDREAHKKVSWFTGGRAEKEERADGGERIASGTGETDGEGNLRVRFTTQALDRDGLYEVRALVRDVNRRLVAGGARVYATALGYYALVDVEQRVVRPGEEVRVRVETVDARHRGVAQAGELVLVRRTGIGGRERSGEAVVRRVPVSTKGDGSAEMTVRFERPGEHLVRFVGKDRRGGEVAGEDVVEVSGEAEDLGKQAKVRAERELYNRGETARVLVVSPRPGAAALLTFEGEKVLDYRVLAPRSRSTTVEVAMRDEYAPNVFVRLSVLGERELFEDEDEVLVFKYLQVEVTPARPVLGPGEMAELVVKTTDQSGAPVSAEVAIGVVDEAVYAIRPDGTPAIKPFFYDQRRRNAVRGYASAGWRYEGVTERLAAEVLAEREERQFGEEKKELAERLRRDARLEAEMSVAEGLSEAPARGRWAAESRAPGAPPPPPALAGKMEAAKDKAPAPAPAETRRRFADTAFWAAHVETDAQGRAVVRFPLPDDLTRWRITARGATPETLVGDGRAEVQTTKGVVARLSAPRFLVEGDSASLRAIGHNYREGPLLLEVSAGAEGALELEGTAPVAVARRVEPGDLLVHDVPFRAARAGAATLAAAARSSAESDRLERPFAVAPRGVPVSEAASGELADRAHFPFEVPAGAIAGTAYVEVRVFPSAVPSLLQALEYLETFPYGCVEQTVSRFLPALACYDTLRRLGVPNEALKARLEQHARLAIVRLQDAQRDDGAWGWWPGGAADPYLTAYVLEGLEEAARGGFFVDGNVLSRGRSGAERMLRAVGGDGDARAALLLALSISGRASQREGLSGDENRALREAGQLSSLGLARLALALHQRGREGNGAELVETLARRAVRAGDEAYWSAPEVSERGGVRPWEAGATAEATATAARALLVYGRGGEAVAGAARWLERRQAGGHWRSTRETAAVLRFLGRYHLERPVARLDGTLQVLVNGALFAEKDLADGRFPPLRIGAGSLKAGKNRVELVQRGTGALRYALRFEAFVREGLDVPAARGPLEVARRYARHVPAALQAAGAALGEDAGYSVVEPSARPKSEGGRGLAEALSGDRVVVELTLEAAEALRYVVLEDPLPAGLEIEGEAEGGARFEARDAKAVFFLTDVPRGKTRLRYVARAITPGRFTALPARTWAMYEPEIAARGAAAPFVVVAEAAALAAREPLPDERYLEAKEHLAAGRHAEARAVFQALLAKWRLRREIEAEVQQALFHIGVALDDAPGLVAAYEKWRDLDPRGAQSLSLDAWRALGLAYHTNGEYDRSFALLGGVAVAYFEERAAVADAYRALGRALPAQEYLEGLLRRAPEREAVIRRWFETARQYYEIDDARVLEGPRPKHWKSGIPQKMYGRAYRDLKDFIAWLPTHPLADDAQRLALDALVRLEHWEGAAAEADALVSRYGESEFVDDALIEAMRAYEKLGRAEQALATRERLVAWRQKDTRGRETASPFVPEAHYLAARVHHARGEMAAAVACYALAAPHFPDAKDAYDYYTQPGIELRDLESFAVGEAPLLHVRSKNLERLSVKVYAVDFMILFLKRKNLASIHEIDLTGITPRLEKEYALGQKDDYRWREQELALPLTEKGVYLVVAKAGEFDESTLVSVSELTVEVQRSSNRVRVYAKAGGKPAAGARVRLTDGQRLLAQGETDARGVFVAQAHVPEGHLSVVAERGGHYALHRD